MTNKTCSVEGCTGKGVITPSGAESFPKGLCCKHYQRLQKHGDIHFEQPHATCCKIPGCVGKGKIKKEKDGVQYSPVFQNGYCVAHFKRFLRHGDPLVTKSCPPGHNLKHNPLYTVWADIRTRTTNEKRSCYKNYGGRGIKMCDRWQGPSGFLNFIEDMGPRPSPQHSIDRRNNDGHYEPDNCCWSTAHEQTANQRTNNEHVGVSWYAPLSKWMARIKVNKKHYYLGYHEFLNDAIAARKDAEKKFGITYQKDLI